MARENDKNAQARLKRIAGQVAGIQQMLEGGRDCVEVLHQLAAVQAALIETGRVILAEQFEAALEAAVAAGDPRARRERLDAMMAMFARFSRLNGAQGGARAGEAP